MRRAFLIAALAATLMAGGAGASAPRAVSLDYCADQFLLALADETQIVAVSPLAASAYSFERARAAGFRRLRANAEEIAPLKPDLALRVWGGEPRLQKLLEGTGAHVVTLEYASDFETIRANIRMAAQALGRQAQGEAMIADLDARLAALAQRPLHAEPAVYVTPGGVTAGGGTMIDAIFQAARVRNAAAEAGHAFWPPLPAERLVLDPPGLVVTGFFRDGDEIFNHWSAARHPALKRLFARVRTVHLPADVLSCPGWFAIEAAEAIAAGIDAEARDAAR